MSIIAISGVKGSGKDLIGKIIQYLTHPKKENLGTIDEIEDFLAYNKNSISSDFYYIKGKLYQYDVWLKKVKNLRRKENLKIILEN
jgi:hypothetical protein